MKCICGPEAIWVWLPFLPRLLDTEDLKLSKSSSGINKGISALQLEELRTFTSNTPITIAAKALCVCELEGERVYV